MPEGPLHPGEFRRYRKRVRWLALARSERWVKDHALPEFVAGGVVAGMAYGISWVAERRVPPLDTLCISIGSACLGWVLFALGYIAHEHRRAPAIIDRRRRDALSTLHGELAALRARDDFSKNATLYVAKLEYRRDPENLPDHWEQDTRPWVWFAQVGIVNRTSRPLEVRLYACADDLERERRWMFDKVEKWTGKGEEGWEPCTMRIEPDEIRMIRLVTSNIGRIDFKPGSARLLACNVLGKNTETPILLRKESLLEPTERPRA